MGPNLCNSRYHNNVRWNLKSSSNSIKTRKPYIGGIYHSFGFTLLNIIIRIIHYRSFYSVNVSLYKASSLFMVNRGKQNTIISNWIYHTTNNGIREGIISTFNSEELPGTKDLGFEDIFGLGFEYFEAGCLDVAISKNSQISARWN